MADNARKNPEQIKISVIIPTFNRAERLIKCLRFLSRQTLPTDQFEVIVIIDGAEDDSFERAQALKTPYNLRVIWQENQGQCATRNRGVAEAKGVYCLFLDDDITANAHLLAEHLHIQIQHNGCIGLGQISLKPASNPDWFAYFYEQGWAHRYVRLNEGAQTPTWEDCYSGNLSVPRMAFLAVGGFATDLPAYFDIELGYRLEQYGLRFVYIPDAIGTHDDYKNFQAMLRDALSQGAILPEISQRHPPMRPKLLGTFNDFHPLEVWFRHTLLFLNIPATWLRVVGQLLGRGILGKTWYRFLNRHLYWLGVRQAIKDADIWYRLTSGTRILMYHAFTKDKVSSEPYFVPIKAFDRQMALIKKLGFRVISLEEYLNHRIMHKFPPARSLIITIDDGYKDVQQLALPVLEKHELRATLFLVSNLMGKQNQWDKNGPLCGRPLMSWEDVKVLDVERISLGGHTCTHPVLTEVSQKQARIEINASKVAIEQAVGYPIHTFAYPYGASNFDVQSLVEAAGYQGACGIESGLNTMTTPLFDLRRIEISGNLSMAGFLIKLISGGQKIIPRLRYRDKNLKLSSV